VLEKVLKRECPYVLAREQVFITRFINKYGLSKAQCDNVWHVVKTTLICELWYDILVSKQLLKEWNCGRVAFGCTTFPQCCVFR